MEILNISSSYMYLSGQTAFKPDSVINLYKSSEIFKDGSIALLDSEGKVYIKPSYNDANAPTLLTKFPSSIFISAAYSTTYGHLLFSVSLDFSASVYYSGGQKTISPISSATGFRSVHFGNNWLYALSTDNDVYMCKDFTFDSTSTLGTWTQIPGKMSQLTVNKNGIMVSYKTIDFNVLFGRPPDLNSGIGGECFYCDTKTSSPTFVSLKALSSYIRINDDDSIITVGEEGWMYTSAIYKTTSFTRTIFKAVYISTLMTDKIISPKASNIFTTLI